MSKVWLVTGSSRGLGRTIAEAVIDSGDQLPDLTEPPLRLPLGSDAVRLIRAADEAKIAEIDRWAELSRSTDADDAVARDLSRL